MDRVGPRLGGGAEHRARVQVALRRERTSDLDAFIHRGPVEGGPIRLRVHTDAVNAHRAGGPGDADRDLAAVRDEQSPEHAPPAQSGMFPCFFGGRVSRFVRSTAKASMTRGLVSMGSMTSSR